MIFLHRLEHVGDEFFYIGRDFFNHGAFLPKNGISVFRDFQNHFKVTSDVCRVTGFRCGRFSIVWMVLVNPPIIRLKIAARCEMVSGGSK